jgi:putative redox protein
MSTAHVVYKGNLHAESKHLKSGQIVETDAPIDNKGRGAAFSPTDLCATSLASCMITTLGIYAEAHGVAILAMEAAVTKHMASDPRRIAKIEVDLTITLPTESMEDAKLRLVLERVALNCPVARSLHPDLVQQVAISFSS